MLAIAKVKEVERLLAAGQLSQRKIAKTTGVSRGIVGAIASGRRPDYETRMLARSEENEPLGPVERCAGCGGRVHMPCRLCRVRKLKAQREAALLHFRRQANEKRARKLLTAIRTRARREAS